MTVGTRYCSSAFYWLSDLLFTAGLLGRSSDYPHFTEEEIETQKGHQLCPKVTEVEDDWARIQMQAGDRASGYPSTSPPVFNLSQHQGLFKWVSSSHQVAKILEFQLQHQSFQWTLISFRTDLLQDGLAASPCSPRDSQESSPAPQFKSINSSALSFLYSPTLISICDYWKNHSLD